MGTKPMQIDITDFVAYGETWDFSGSIATHGPNAAQSTWNAAKTQAQREPMLTTEEELDAMRAFVRSSGGWDDQECAAFTPEELNALFVQWIAGDMRENGMDQVDLEDFDWAEYEARASEGRISGNIYRGDNGKVYFYLGS